MADSDITADTDRTRPRGGPARPKVSVVISAYNKQDYIAEAVGSVLAQTEPAVEVVVVDDCSTDGTRDVVRGLAAQDPRVRLVALDRNVGQPAALNVGMSAARGDWVAILDGDDWVAPWFYGHLLELAERKGAAVVASDMQWVEDGLARPWRRLLLPGEGEPLRIRTADFIRRSMPYQMRPLSFLQPMFRRELVERGLRYDEGDRFDLDFGILVRATLLGGPLVVSRRVGYFYRQLPGSMMSTRGVATLRGMKASNDALLDDCIAHGDRESAMLIRRRSRAVAREIARAELVAAIRRGGWGAVAAKLAVSPGHTLALAWRRVRGPLFWLWRRWRTALRLRSMSERAAFGALTVELGWQADAVIGPWAATLPVV
jgi:succinoglycan biosynthesis protein ExoO